MRVLVVDENLMALKRTEFARKTPMKQGKPMARTAVKAGPKAAPEPKIRLRKCVVKTCRAPFAPRSMTHKACGPACAEIHTADEKARKLKRERQAGLAKLKTKRDFVKEAQVAFNAFIRARDAHLPCICCGRTSEKQYLTGTNWDCGHYRSTGSAPHLRFVEDNAHRQLTVCNRHGAGRAVDYRIGLIARIGLARVEAIEADNAPRNYTIDDLKAIKAHYTAKRRELKNNSKNLSQVD